MSNNNKMKGLLKGLRYISQIFDNEKEPEMQIGYPTDVKHVAHIGWDGPSVNSPSWMKEFKSPTAYASAPLNNNGNPAEGPNSLKWVSENATRRSGRVPNSPSRDLPELPKASRRQQSTSGANNATASPGREKVEKTRQRRSSKNSSKETTTDSPRQSRRSMDSNSGVQSPGRNLPEIPKKNRRKKSKDGGGSSSRSRSKALASPSHDQFMATFSDPGPDSKPDKSKGNELDCQNLPVFDEAEEIKGLIT